MAQVVEPDALAALGELLALSPSKRRRALKRLDNDALVVALEDVAYLMDELPVLRLAMWQSARERDPKVTQTRLAKASGVSEPAVIQGLRKARQLAEAG